MEQIPYIVPMQRSRTTVEGTKPQCQPIDLRCSLRGPLLRREKNKLIERRGRERERRNGGGKERRGKGRMEGRRGSAEREKKRLDKENVGPEERALLEEESAKERNERGTKERTDQRAAWWEMQSRMRPLCAQRKGRFLPRSRSCVTFARLIATSITTARWFTSDRRNERRRDFGWITANPVIKRSLFLFSRFGPLKTIARRFVHQNTIRLLFSWTYLPRNIPLIRTLSDTSKPSFNYQYTDIPNILFFNLMFIFRNVTHNVSHNMKL